MAHNIMQSFLYLHYMNIYHPSFVERLPMELKVQYTNAEIEPFVWYKFYSDKSINNINQFIDDT